MMDIASSDVNVLRPREYVRRLARQQIINAIQADIDGGEGLMKEVWEECLNDQEQAEATDMLAKIIIAIEALT